MQFDQPRPLNEAERRTLDVLLAPEFPGVAELRAQLPHAQVIGKCDCGCPTVDLHVPPDVPRSDVVTRSRLAPVEGRVAPVGDEPPGDIILFVDDGRLSYLEYVSYDDPSPSEWPPLDRVTVTVVEAPVGPPIECVCPCGTGRLYVARELVGPMYLMNPFPNGYETVCQPRKVGGHTLPNCGQQYRSVDDVGWVLVAEPGDS
jgi:hypothetical protein